MPRRRPPSTVMRRALAALTVAVTHSSAAGSAAAERALAVLDWQRFELATGRMDIDVYISADMPRGWLLRDGQRNVLIHPAAARMVAGLSSAELAPWASGRGLVALDRLLLGPAMNRLRTDLQLPRRGLL